MARFYAVFRGSTIYQVFSFIAVNGRCDI
ncbi:hypothetical protein RSK20926_05262 [Roseobacter sp. SK209-2-6]|nr:hypothetical protein RSK20926_05262 [Roseobacter sp. SK209-2-6]